MDSKAVGTHSEVGSHTWLDAWSEACTVTTLEKETGPAYHMRLGMSARENTGSNSQSVCVKLDFLYEPTRWGL